MTIWEAGAVLLGRPPEDQDGRGAVPHTISGGPFVYYGEELGMNGSRIIMVINTSEEARVVKFGRTANQYAGICGYLSTTGAAVTLLTPPPTSIVVLK